MTQFIMTQHLPPCGSPTFYATTRLAPFQGIAWSPIQFFNNAIVCDLIESKRPVGVLSVLDDTCATMSAVTKGADSDFRNKMDAQVMGRG